MKTSPGSDNVSGSSAPSARLCKTKLAAFFSVPLLAAAVAACSGPAIQSVSGSGLNASGNTVASEGRLGSPSNFLLAGSGVCGRVQIDFGDGSIPAQVAPYDFANPTAVTHTYTGWAGKKKVKAGSIQDCVGTPEMTFTVTPTIFKVGYVPTLADACGPIPNRPPLRKNTKVRVMAIPGATTPAGTPGPTAKINFGCPLDGCIYDEDGMPGQAPANYPFPGLRPFSMVMRVGADVYQGGTDATFTTRMAGTLEICRNEGNYANHTGGWGIFVDVDETGAQ